MKKIFEKQLYQVLTFVVLVLVIWWIAQGDYKKGSYLGLATPVWLWLSVATAAIHQFAAAIFWRGELHYRWLSRWFGKRAFQVWSFGFMILLLGRPLILVGLAIANSGTLSINPWMGYGLAGLFLLPLTYLFYSIGKYFGFRRALGIDHFFPDEFKTLPLVNQGIFRWFSNAMYLFGFLVLWIPGLVYFSRTAFLAAAFNHLFIWAHYYFTELPDLEYIYSS